jgi:glycolate oxidase FAD binding subunit
VNPATALAPFAADVPGAPASEITVAPASAAEAATVLATASRHRLRVLVWGAGTHQGYGYRVDPDVVLATSAFDDLLVWEPDDLTLTVGTGVTVATIEDHVGERRQSALLPESEPDATAGGIVAAGLSGWRRLRFGPTRDRVLEAVIVTGDGRVIKGGARLVKNATGYDLPRLATGSFGSLGLIVHVCFKLWPEPPERATVTISDPESAFQTAFRPLAVVEERDRSRVYLAGTDAEIAAQATDLGGTIQPGHHWPDPLDGLVRLVLRVPAGRTADAVARLAPDMSYQAAHGVGEIRIGSATTTPEAVTELRDWAESIGGALVIAAAPESLSGVVDPWGTPPASLPLQRRVKEAFDPAGVMNPGRLPGGL